MNNSTKLYFLLCACCFSIFTVNAQSKNKKRPNIILIMADDLGFGDVGFNGNTIIKTPNLDKLAKKGIQLNRFYAASPVCSPTRASCLTGRNPFRQGIYTANTGHLKTEEITLAEILKENGYVTGIFGKWHLGSLTTKEKDANRGNINQTEHFSTPDMHGFDNYFVTESKVPTHDPLKKPAEFDTQKGESLRFGWTAIKNNKKSQFYGTNYWVGQNKKAESKHLTGDDTKIIVTKTIPFIQKAIDNNTPFFTVVWTHTPHLPLVVDETYTSMYPDLPFKKQIFNGSITSFDHQIGKLYQYLVEQGIADNTMIWFASDNGPEVRTPASAGKYRGKKRDLFEGGLRVPAFVVWPKEFPANQQTDVAMVTSDYLPTITSLLDLNYVVPVPIDGKDMSGILLKNRSKRKSAIGFQYPNAMSWVTDRYKLIKNSKTAQFELYDLILDPTEKTNIISKKGRKAKQLKKQLHHWVESCKNSALGNDYNNNEL